MATTYNGTSSGISARQAPSTTVPASTDQLSEESHNIGIRRAFDFLAYLMAKVGLIDAVSTWTAKQAFSAGLSSGAVPSAGTDVVRKTELDAEATTRADAVSNEASARATGDTTTLASANAYADATASGTPTSLIAGLDKAPAVRKRGGLAFFDNVGAVHVTASIQDAADNFLTGPSGTTLFVVPVGFRPADNVFLPVYWFDASATVGSRSKLGLIRIDQSGGVRFHADGVAGGSNVLASGDDLWFGGSPPWPIP